MAYDLTHLGARLNLQKCLRSKSRSREFCKAHNTLKLPHPSFLYPYGSGTDLSLVMPGVRLEPVS
jgi:hypothetical protein